MSDNHTMCLYMSLYLVPIFMLKVEFPFVKGFRFSAPLPLTLPPHSAPTVPPHSAPTLPPHSAPTLPPLLGAFIIFACANLIGFEGEKIDDFCRNKFYSEI
uniref:Uncharacterized protein n=1 Tax=Cacopsylla melanoneura TaxID=428564 RepID=A0A8D9FIV8_9HEMI